MATRLNEREAAIIDQGNRWRMAHRLMAIRELRSLLGEELRHTLTPDIESDFANVWQEEIQNNPVTFSNLEDVLTEYIQSHTTCDKCGSWFASVQSDESPCGGAVATTIECRTCGHKEVSL